MSKEIWWIGNPVGNAGCVYLGSESRFLESLIMCSSSKCLPHPCRMLLLCASILSSLRHSWGNFKLFSLSLLIYFGLIISCIWLCKDELCSKDYFFCVCSDIYPIPVIICNNLVGNWSYMIFLSFSILFPWYVPTIK